MAGFVYAPFGDLEAVARLIDDETAAIMIEPIQGEGGVQIPPDGFLAGLRKLADEHELLLMFDEVQTGCGRTGDWFAYQGFGVTPDVMTLSKALCGGLAGGAMLTTAEIAKSLRPGMHACTFGGNPIAARAGLAFIEAVERDNLLEQRQAARRGLPPAVRATCSRSATWCATVRVRGVMIGVELSIEGARDGQGLPGAETAGQLHPRNGDPPAAGHEPYRGAGPRGLRHSRRGAEEAGGKPLAGAIEEWARGEWRAMTEEAACGFATRCDTYLPWPT